MRNDALGWVKHGIAAIAVRLLKRARACPWFWHGWQMVADLAYHDGI